MCDDRVHGDVFRPPQKGMLLSVLIGNGVQIAIMSFITLSKIVYSVIYWSSWCLYFSLRLSWFSITSKPWSTDDMFVLLSVFVFIFLSMNLGAIVCYVLLGTPAGYTSARLYKSESRCLLLCGFPRPILRSVWWWAMEEERRDDCCCMSWVGSEEENGWMTIDICSVIFGIFFVLNIVLWANGSSAAIPFTTFLALLALWFCVATPLVFVGAYLGFKRPVRWSEISRVVIDILCLKTKVSENPVRTNQIPRQVPEQSLYTKPLPGTANDCSRHRMWSDSCYKGILMGGILPFGCIFIQLFFILNSIW